MSALALQSSIGFLLPLLLVCPVLAQQAGGVSPSGSTVHVIRAVIGAKGEARNGTFVMTEPRSTFYAPDDKEVIVYFEWEGDRGTHHCEGSVRGPNGEFATMSSFDYVAKQPRFAGFWKVPLSSSTPPGGWVFESRVDGQAAGQINFQVIVAAKPEGLSTTPVTVTIPPPTPSEIYSRAVAAMVDIEQLDSQSRSIGHSSGFLLPDGNVATSFRAIDGATTLRLRLSNGQQLPSPSIAAWDRSQDWAILATNAKPNSSLKLAPAKSWKVGDQCFWLDVKTDGSRIIADAPIVGLKSPQRWGDRIDFSGVFNAAGMGGALLNDHGEVIGILGGTLPDSFVNTTAPQIQTDSQLVFYTVGGIAVAANLLPQQLPPSAVTLQDLWAKGLMTPHLTASRYVLFGMLTEGKAEDKKGKPHGERDFKIRFQHGDTAANALIHFNSNDSFKSVTMLKLYDVDNHLVVSSNPEKLNVKNGDHTERAWQLPLANLPVGIYRVDIELTEGVAWRQYFRLD